MWKIEAGSASMSAGLFDHVCTAGDPLFKRSPTLIDQALIILDHIHTAFDKLLCQLSKLTRSTSKGFQNCAE